MECCLRGWKREDAEALAGMLNNPAIQDWLRDGIPYPYTLNDAKAYIAAMQKANQHTTFAFAVTAEKKVVGSLGVFRQGNIHVRTAELGYYIAQPYWGKGLGTDAVKQACAYVFAHTDILRIFAEPFLENGASCRVLEKAGFEREGILRQNAVKKGRVMDMAMYALLKYPH